MADEAAAVSAAILGEAEFERLLRAAAHGARPCRDRAILHLLWDLGATVRQVVTLEAGQVDFLSGAILWPERPRAALTAEALRLLTTYVSMERDARCPTLFAGRHGRAMRPADLARLFRRLAAQTGIAVDPLSLRRAACARLLRTRPVSLLAAWRRAGASQGPPPELSAGPGALARREPDAAGSARHGP